MIKPHTLTKPLRTHLMVPLLLILLASCGPPPDPNKQIDEGKITENTYHSEEIGWTMTIPEGWEITLKSESDSRTQKGLEAVQEHVDIDVDISDMKHLLNLQKGRFNIFQSSSEPFELEYEGEWEENHLLLKQMLAETFANQGIRTDTSSSTARIDGKKFEVFNITLFDPEGNVVLYQKLFSRLINGYDFGASISYRYKKDIEELLEAWEGSTFE